MPLKLLEKCPSPALFSHSATLDMALYTCETRARITDRVTWSVDKALVGKRTNKQNSAYFGARRRRSFLQIIVSTNRATSRRYYADLVHRASIDIASFCE